jgi:hypothetical protein
MSAEARRPARRTLTAVLAAAMSLAAAASSLYFGINPTPHAEAYGVNPPRHAEKAYDINPTPHAEKVATMAKLLTPEQIAATSIYNRPPFG